MVGFLQPAHERVHPQAQLQIQHQRSVFHQHVFIAGAPIHHVGSGMSSRQGRNNGGIGAVELSRGGPRRISPNLLRIQGVDHPLLRKLAMQRFIRGQAPKANAVVRSKLAEFP